MAIDTLGANALASNTVTTAKIAADAVTSAKIPAGAVVASDVADGSVTTAKLADNAVTSAKALNLGRRNLVINGAMRIAQRAGYNISTTGSPEFGGPDRFHIWTYTSNEEVVAAISQDTDVPSGNGFAHSYKLDVTTAESAVAADEALLIGTFLEAQNLQHLEYGTSSAKAITLSFWIKSTKTGTYCLSVTAPDGSRNYIKEYTVSASNTWEKKEITIPGDQSGAINNDNGQGLWLQWVLMAGTNRHKAADAWSGTTSDIATSNQVNALDNTSNNIYLTGIQLEVGSTATDFEHLSFTEDLALCQRYFCQSYTYGIYAGANSTSTPLRKLANGYNYDSIAQFQFPVEMRTGPTVVLYNPRTGTVNGFTGDSSDFTGAAKHASSTRGVAIYRNQSVSATVFTGIHATADAEL